MSEPWLAVRVEPSGETQPVIDALFAAGAQGVQEEGTAVITHFPPGTSADVIEGVIKAVDAGATVSAESAPDVDWSKWKASVQSHVVGRLTIAPPWLASPDDPMTVVIEPAMAFGTGEHATTRGITRLMQQVEPMPRTVADLGAGSAVLSICAAKLGAKRVTAIELDEDAIPNAEANIHLNGAAQTVRVVQGDAAVILPLIAPVDLVLANILSSVLLELLPVIRDSLASGGHVILSGILAAERGMMSEAILQSGWIIESEDLEEEWWSVRIARQR